MSQNIPTRRAAYLYVVYWLILLFVHTYILVDFGVQPWVAIADSFVTHFIFALSCLIIFITLRYYQPTRENLFFLRVWAMLLAVVNSFLLLYVLKNIFGSDPSYLQLLEKSEALRFCYQLILIAFFTLLMWMSNYMKELRSVEEHKEQTQSYAREAELYNLRQQLQPHFLFNSLNSISALAGSKPEEARKMIQHLSEFLRHTLKKDDTHLITLREEMHQLELYLSIEKVRFGNRLAYRMEIDEKCHQHFLPGLILQPLVENAIKFGLYDTLGEVEILIRSSCAQPGMLQLEITNPYDAATHNKAAGTGFGLDSVKRRLYLLFARNDLLQTEKTERQFTVKINIPQS